MMWRAPPAPIRLSVPPCSGQSRPRPCGWPRKTRPALTGPARGGCEFRRSGRKNARGAGRTKEWTRRSEGRMFEQVELRRVVVIAWGRDGLVVTAYLAEVGSLDLPGARH